jgi:hypothetical protein
MKKTLLVSLLLLTAVGGSASAQIIAAGDIYVGTSANTGTGALGETFSSISVPDNNGNGDTNRTLASTEIGISGVSISATYRTSQDQNDFGKSYPAPYQAQLSGYNGTGENGGVPEPLDLTLSGLTPNTDYNFLVYADEDTGTTNTVTFTGSGDAYNLSGAYNTFTPTQGDNYIEATEKTNGSGDITFDMTSTNQYTSFNAVTVEAIGSVPEPSAYLLMGLGAAALLFVSRLRSRRI